MLSNLEGQIKQTGAEDKINDVLEEVHSVRKELGYPLGEIAYGLRRAYSVWRVESHVDGRIY